MSAAPVVSDRLEQWSQDKGPRTIGSLIDCFGPKSFAMLFLVLLALPALPVPTGAVSHVMEAVAMLLALELMAGRTDIWVPDRWQDKVLKGVSGPKFVNALVKRIRWFERFSRPRGTWLLERRLTSMVYGFAVFGFSLTAFLAPPFSGLDTLPALGVVIMSLGMLLGDAVFVGVGAVTGTLGVVLVIGLGRAIAGLF